jgi:hypothetical protein
MGTILIIGLMLLAAYFVFTSWTPQGIDARKGFAALVALGAALWAWIAGLFQSAPPV